ncbi:hypothetical protein, partial [Fusobacterium necrophorum]
FVIYNKLCYNKITKKKCLFSKYFNIMEVNMEMDLKDLVSSVNREREYSFSQPAEQNTVLRRR